MATVTVSINGRNYRMACDDGQEEHLGRLARELDQRFGIHHATIQIELADSDEICALTPESVV
jgi:cell division protein ZapA (FtsZ GTPase activity inhibitor)